MIIFGKGSNCIAGSHQSILNTEIGKMISPWKHDVGEQEGWCFKHKMKYEMGGKGWGNNEAKRRLWSAGFTHKTTKMTWGEAARISVCFRLCTNEGPLTNTYGVNRLPDLVVWLSSLTQREFLRLLSTVFIARHEISKLLSLWSTHDMTFNFVSFKKECLMSCQFAILKL